MEANVIYLLRKIEQTPAGSGLLLSTVDVQSKPG
jgi:hypothetical protein